MAWACMASNGTGSLMFVDDVRKERSSRVNSDMHRVILSTPTQSSAAKLIGQRFTVQMDNDLNILQKQPRSFSKQRSGIFCNG